MIDLEKHISIQDNIVSTLETFTTGKNREHVLSHHQELFILLNELQGYRNERKNKENLTHEIKSHEKSSSGIFKVECTCGEVTRYKVPLNSLSEFECPKRKVVHAGKI